MKPFSNVETQRCSAAVGGEWETPRSTTAFVERQAGLLTPGVIGVRYELHRVIVSPSELVSERVQPKPAASSAAEQLLIANGMSCTAVSAGWRCV